MSGALVGFVLECKHCSYRMPDDATVESYLLHMQVEHDTDEVELDLKGLCRCGAAMTLVDGSTRLHRFRCPACGGEGTARAGPRANGDRR